LFIAEGPKIVDEFLRAAPQLLHQLFATPEWIAAHPGTNVEVFEVTEGELARISQLSTPHQVLALVQMFPHREPASPNGRLTLALDGIQDPGNFGTILRIADWFGVPQIIAGRESADRYNPKVVQASMGSLVRVPVHYFDISEWISRNREVSVYATGLNGRPVSEFGKIREGVIIIGNEARGIDSELLQFANDIITIPGKGEAESLNAAVATGIILSHIT